MRLLIAKCLGVLVIIGVLAVSTVLAEPNFSKVEEGFTYTPLQAPVSGDKGTYGAYVRVYIIEPASDRWDYSDGTDYTNAFLDFAYNEHVNIGYEETLNETVVFNAATAGFPGIREDNIMAVIAVSHDEGETFYGDPPDNPYTGYYLDACAGADPYTNYPDVDIPGYTHNVLIEECTATW